MILMLGFGVLLVAADIALAIGAKNGVSNVNWKKIRYKNVINGVFTFFFYQWNPASPYFSKEKI